MRDREKRERYYKETEENKIDLFKTLWRRKWPPTPVHLPEKSDGWRTMVVYSPRGHQGLDMTERLHFHFHFLWQKAGYWTSV